MRFPAAWLASNIKPNWIEIPTNEPAELRIVPTLAIEIQFTCAPRHGALRARKALGVSARSISMREAPAIGCNVDCCARGVAEQKEPVTLMRGAQAATILIASGVNGSRAEA